MKITNKLILSALIAFLFIIPLANAKPYFYTSQSPHSICSGVRSTFVFYLKNDMEETNNFNINVSPTNNNLIWIPHSIKLIPGDTTKVYVFINPSLKTEGNFSFKISAEYNGQTISQVVNYDVINCNRFTINIPTSNEYCIYYPITLNGSITNNGKFNNQSVTLTTSEGTLSKKDFVLNSNQTDHFTIKIKSATAPKTKTITVKATIKDTNQTITKTVSLPIRSCASYTASISSVPSPVCNNQVVAYNITLKNTGKVDDTYTVSSNQGVLNQTKFTLVPNSEKKISLKIIPKVSGSHPLIVTLLDKYNLKKQLTSTYSSKNCCGVSLVSSPSPITICSNEITESAEVLGLLNTGEKTNFTITSNAPWAIPAISSVLLPKNGEQTFLTRIHPFSVPGTYRAIIKASADGCEDTAYITLNVKNCYNFKINSTLKQAPLENQLCTCSSTPFDFKVSNTGSVKDTYNLGLVSGDPRLISFENQKITLNPMTSGQFKGTIKVPCTYNKSSNLVFKVSSQSNPDLTKEITVTIVPKNCYGVNAVMSNANTCAEKEFNLTALITNTGNKTDTYSIKYNCPSWVEPASNTNEITIDSKQKQIITLHGKADVSDSGKTYLCALSVHSKTNPSVSTFSTSRITIRPKLECFCLKPVLSNATVTIKAGGSKVDTLSINNCGIMNETYTLTIEGDNKSWLVLEPNTLTLSPKDSGKFYIAILPPLKANPGTYNFSLVLKSKRSQTTTNINLKIVIQ